MKVLVIGSGGREHAIARQFNNSASVSEVFVAPGNDGMKNDAECIGINATDFDALASFAIEQKIDLTFVGPEQPLSEGIVDYFTDRGLRIFGPTKAAAQIEGSKSFAKELMQKYGYSYCRIWNIHGCRGSESIHSTPRSTDRCESGWACCR